MSGPNLSGDVWMEFLRQAVKGQQGGCGGMEILLHPDEIRAIEKRFGTVENWWVNHISSGDVWREFFGQAVEGKREVVGGVAHQDDRETGGEGTDQR